MPEILAACRLPGINFNDHNAHGNRSVRDSEDSTSTPTTGVAVYRYDAFGRRIVKRRQAKKGDPIATQYHGWDGDRLVHTETEAEITHTVYEPGSFVPLLSLHKTLPEKEPSLGALVLSQQAYDTQPQSQRSFIDQAMADMLAMSSQERMALFSALPGTMGEETEAFMQSMQREYRSAKAQNPVQVRHFHCDHLGTPIGMTQATGEHLGALVWAARYDAWGKTVNEHNPQGIEQPIRFQGQQFDKETGLHYNRFRHYDPAIGRYVTQDPLGIAGGVNNSLYVINPLQWTDSLGLQGFGPLTPMGALENVFNKSVEYIKESPITNYGKAAFGKLIDGGQFGAQAGGTIAFGLGISASSGIMVDTGGRSCQVSSVCAILGPIAGGESCIQAAAGTGKLTPGDTAWQISGVGAAVIGIGGKAEFSAANDGGIGIQGGKAIGLIAGSGVQVCKQMTSKTCSN